MITNSTHNKILFLVSILFLFGIRTIAAKEQQYSNVQKIKNDICELVNDNTDMFSYGNLPFHKFSDIKISNIKISVKGTKVFIDILKNNTALSKYTFDAKYSTIDILMPSKDREYIRLSCKTGIKCENYSYNQPNKLYNTSDYDELLFTSKYPMLRTKLANGLLCLIKIVNNSQIKAPNSLDKMPSGMSLKRYKINYAPNNPKIYSIDNYWVEDINSQNGNNSSNGNLILKPVKATITDSQGSFTSSNFNCPNMVVYDKGSSVQLSWGGENIPLSKSSSPDTYIASQSKSGTTMKFVAYRSSNTRKIYLVICTTKGNGRSVEINFKP